MQLRHELKFAGYGADKSTVLLGDNTSVTHCLQPIWKGEKVKICVDGVNGNDGSSAESDFVESECSESYVSSASSCSYRGGSPYESNFSGCTSSPRIGRSNLQGCREDDAVAGVGTHDGQDMTSVSFPVHGTLLSIRDPALTGGLLFQLHLADKEHTPYAEACRTAVVLGYSEQGEVFLLPVPSPCMTKKPSYYQSTPLLQLSLSELREYYSWGDNQLLEPTCDDVQSWELPHLGGFMVRPAFEHMWLATVFAVASDRLYYLSAWSAFVQFVGVAWGLPWVRKFPVNIPEGDPIVSFVAPLVGCNCGRSLREVYGLRELRRREQQGSTDVGTVPVPPGPVANADSSGWREFLRELQEVVGDAVADWSQLPAAAEHCDSKETTPPTSAAVTAAERLREDDGQLTSSYVVGKRSGDGGLLSEASVGVVPAVESMLRSFGTEVQQDIGRNISKDTGLPSPFLFTLFLKAVAYWKSNLLTEEQQSSQPLAFIDYYGTNPHERFVEAIDLLRVHQSKFLSETRPNARSSGNYCDQCVGPWTVQRIVRMLAEPAVTN
ncbi:hypothetical protein, conserved [Trypanosoma brucei brucei TREU927]|uniref:Uncharacterized protein n=1 Tax=Trypanosoma brucei brucei (strain 927/4 GUTat10.1) TaxID=185431 RepID=Q385B5_TRYB2|nr:hypothetical protein, conserved [Trypanosoma brucei brucei TREU927]EAN79616.1 hypothetical protein, conserved [Trypanosoma brucei brucei TREU927]